jgi:DNA-binding NarL/FixJ family response regulator
MNNEGNNADNGALTLTERDQLIIAVVAHTTAQLLQMNLIDPLVAPEPESPTSPQPPRRPIQRLTGREHQVLLLLLDGQSNKLAGRTLGISPRTIEVHRHKIMEKLGANNAVALARAAREAGIVE